MRDSGPYRSVNKPLQSADGNGGIKLPAPAGRLAGMAANAAADGSQRIRLAGVAVGFFEAPLGDQGNVAPRLGMNWTSLHARKVRFQPVQVDEFGLLRGQLASPSSISFRTCTGLRPIQRD